MIPTRYSDKWDLATRRRHFTDALAGYLDAVAGNRKFLLVAEPDLVVLLVYAIARLLPPALRDRISFSTYETAPERIFTTIAAIPFEHSESSDLPQEHYRRDFVLNTFNGKCSEPTPESRKYAQMLWEKWDQEGLLGGGWQAADRMIEACVKSGMREVSHLLRCPKLEDVARAAVDPQATPVAVSGQSPEADGYLKRRTAQLLANLPPGDRRLEQLAASSGHRRALLALTLAEGLCQTQVKRLIGLPGQPAGCDKDDLEWYLSADRQIAFQPYEEAALDRYVGVIQAGETVQFLHKPEVRQERKEKVLRRLVDKLLVEELPGFLAIPWVPTDVKNLAVERLASAIASSDILGFLRNGAIPLPYRCQAFYSLEKKKLFPPELRLEFLRMREMPEDIKVYLVRENEAPFSGAEALALLSDRQIPEKCRLLAVGKAKFLDGVTRGELLRLLCEPLVSPEQKKAQVDRLAASLTEDDVMAILRHAGVDEAIKQQILARADAPRASARPASSRSWRIPPQPQDGRCPASASSWLAATRPS